MMKEEVLRKRALVNRYLKEYRVYLINKEGVYVMKRMFSNHINQEHPRTGILIIMIQNTEAPQNIPIDSTNKKGKLRCAKNGSALLRYIKGMKIPNSTHPTPNNT
eukprot:TRINITY_DN5174_c0_g1_i1.p3 TRINITY_DN5174_c0_g1~~TRINITY_DN5174_c0_g1_i1.p3  ORF type:complete len:105 (+),score=11.98 TRINITY_DN5174_c0_g1_i1:1083-1397(+)